MGIQTGRIKPKSAPPLEVPQLQQIVEWRGYLFWPQDVLLGSINNNHTETCDWHLHIDLKDTGEFMQINCKSEEELIQVKEELKAMCFRPRTNSST